MTVERRFLLAAAGLGMTGSLPGSRMKTAPPSPPPPCVPPHHPPTGAPPASVYIFPSPACHGLSSEFSAASEMLISHPTQNVLIGNTTQRLRMPHLPKISQLFVQSVHRLKASLRDSFCCCFAGFLHGVLSKGDTDSGNFRQVFNLHLSFFVYFFG